MIVTLIGRDVLTEQKAAGTESKLVGLLLTEKGVLRSHQVVITEFGKGEITSGTFSPTSRTQYCISTSTIVV